mmetsp:Transcript_33669/g.73506  ORF Transcript_33669/g.73506 Transcript_33669/m.73506 type:complete len:309 (+) Transcript_33669:988-1914(+)
MRTERPTSLWQKWLVHWKPCTRHLRPSALVAEAAPGHCRLSSLWHALVTRGLSAVRDAARRTSARIRPPHAAGNPGSEAFSLRQVRMRLSPGARSLQCSLMASWHTRRTHGFIRMSSASAASSRASSSRHSGVSLSSLRRRHACTRPSPGWMPRHSLSTSPMHFSASGRSSFQFSAARISCRRIAMRHPGDPISLRLVFRHLSTRPRPGCTLGQSSFMSAAHCDATSGSSRTSPVLFTSSRLTAARHCGDMAGSPSLSCRQLAMRLAPSLTSPQRVLRSALQLLKMPCLKRQLSAWVMWRSSSFLPHR